VALVKLELRDSTGKLVSDNLYWMGGTSADYRNLNRLGEAQIKATARTAVEGDEGRVKVELENTGNTAAIELKLTLLEADGKRECCQPITAITTFRFCQGRRKRS